MDVYVDDFTFCTKAHIGTEKAHTGGNNAVHIALFQISGRIFPHNIGGQACREGLTVVGMAAQMETTPASATS